MTWRTQQHKLVFVASVRLSASISNPIYIHNVTLGIISFPFCIEPIYRLCSAATTRTHLGWPTTIFALEDIIAYFIFRRLEDWDEWTQAYELLHLKNEIDSTDDNCHQYSLSLTHAIAFQIRFALTPVQAVSSGKRVAHWPSWVLLQMLQSILFVKQTQSNWIIINYNNKTIFSWKEERTESSASFVCYFRCVQSTNCDGVLLLPPQLLLRSRFICMSAIPSRSLRAFWRHQPAANNNKITAADKKRNDVVCFGCLCHVIESK